MTRPVPYDRQFNFQNQQLLTPADPPPADEMDAEFNAIKLTLDQILGNLALIQRDDGALVNESVARVTLSSDIDLGFGAPTIWRENTRYVADFDTIFYGSFFYTCIETHVSDPSPIGFDNDIAKWELIADFSASAVQGLGTMSTQNANNVVISGGSISGTVIAVAAPDASTKAANKQYVDDKSAALTAYIDAQVTTLHGQLWAPSGTLMMFRQSVAPTGWTKNTSFDDRALRVTSGVVGNGGVLGFSTVFAKIATDDFTLSTSHMPSHNHGGSTGSAGAHSHTYIGNTNAIQAGTAGVNATAPPSGETTSTDGAHTHTVASQGGGAVHQHGMDIRVLYTDVIIASKN